MKNYGEIISHMVKYYLFSETKLLMHMQLCCCWPGNPGSLTKWPFRAGHWPLDVSGPHCSLTASAGTLGTAQVMSAQLFSPGNAGSTA